MAEPRPVLGRRERDIAACLIDTVAGPGGPLPPLGATRAVDAFDALLASAPAINRAGLRAMLIVVEVGPRLTGEGRRLRALPRDRRAPALAALAGRWSGKPLQALYALGKLAYYGEEPVMRRLGYDAGAVVERARALRIAEDRW
jgi:hypothetical protein